MECPEGERSVGKVRVTQGDLYYFSMRDCGPCPRAATCLTRGEQVGQEKRRRRVYLSDVRKARIVAGEVGRAWRETHGNCGPESKRTRRADEPAWAPPRALLGPGQGHRPVPAQRPHGERHAGGETPGAPPATAHPIRSWRKARTETRSRRSAPGRRPGANPPPRDSRPFRAHFVSGLPCRP